MPEYAWTHAGHGGHGCGVHRGHVRHILNVTPGVRVWIVESSVINVLPDQLNSRLTAELVDLLKSCGIFIRL